MLSHVLEIKRCSKKSADLLANINLQPDLVADSAFIWSCLIFRRSLVCGFRNCTTTSSKLKFSISPSHEILMPASPVLTKTLLNTDLWVIVNRCVYAKIQRGTYESLLQDNTFIQRILNQLICLY